MPKKRTFYSEEERKAHHEKKQREADLQIQELTKHWENDPKTSQNTSHSALNFTNILHETQC